MAYTGTDLLQEVLDTQGVTISSLLQGLLAARLQAAIDAGTDSNLQIAAVLGANPQILGSVPSGETALTFLSGIVGTARTTVTEAFTLTADAASVDEGADATFTISGADPETEYIYQITGVSADDITGGTLGAVTTDVDGNATITVPTVADATTEGAETLTVSIIGHGVSAAAIVNDTSLDPPVFNLPAALADLDTAQAALADFNTANPTVDADLTAAIGAYDAAVTGSDVANDSDATAAARLSSQQAVNASNLTIAEDALAAANTAIAAVDGLSAAVAADEAADAAVTTTAAAAGTAQTALDLAEAAWVINSNAGAFINTSVNTGGVLTVAVDESVSDGTPFADGDPLTLTAVDGATGLVSLTDPDVAWTADQIAFFEGQQAAAADFIAAFNADVAADTAAADAVTAAAASQATVDFLDIDTDAYDELGLVGAGFTLTTVADEAAPSEAEIAAEVAALEAAAAATQATLDAATIADTAADTVLTDAVTAADVSEITAGGDVIEAGSITVAADGTATASFASDTGVVVPLIVDNAGTLEFAAAVTQPDAELQALLAASIANEAAEATLAAATVADNAADLAVTTFNGLISDFDAVNDNNPLTDALPALETAVTAAEDAITDLATAITDLDDAEAADVAQTALEADVTAAEAVITDEGYALPDQLADADALTASADGDIYMISDLVAGNAAAIDAFGDAGDDVLFIGADFTLNTGDIATDGDNAALEVFFVEANAGADTVVTLETSVFGSNAATPEVAEITLTGVAAADLAFADGMITVA